MHLDIYWNISVKKRHKLIIRHECVGMLRINGLLHLLEYPELTGSQKGSQCFNLSNKKPENGQTEGADTADHLFSPSCHNFCCLVWIAYQFYASLPHIDRHETLMVGVSLEKNPKLRRPTGKRQTQNWRFHLAETKMPVLLAICRGCFMDVFPTSK